MTITELASIYDEKIDFIFYWKRVVAESLYLKSFPCRCVLHDEVNGASFSYSYKQNIWSCFGKCKTTGKVVQFHQRYLKKKDETITLYKTLKSLHQTFPELDLPNPIHTTKISTNHNDNEDIEGLENILFSNEIDNLTKNIKSDDMEIEIINTNDINIQILNLFIERRGYK